MKYLVFSCILLSCALMQACGGSGGGSTGATTAGVANRPATSLNGTGNPPSISNSVDPQGRCTPQFISDYDELILNNQLLKNSTTSKETVHHAESVNKSCDKFFSHHLSSATCMARVTYNGTIMVGPISASTVKGLCDVVKQAIPPTPTQGEAVAPKKISPKKASSSKKNSSEKSKNKIPNAPLSSLQGSELTFEVLNPELFTQTGGGTEKYLQDGKLVGQKDLSLQSTFCKVIETSTPPSQGTKFSGQKIQKNPDADLKMNHILILANSPSAGKVSFLCVSGSSAEMTIKDLRESLGSVVKVSLKTP